MTTKNYKEQHSRVDTVEKARGKLITDTMKLVSGERPVRNRIAVSAMFFMHGLCFASWASRIPDIKESLALSSSELGTVLLALPAGFVISLPFASCLIGSMGSRKVVIISSVLCALSLVAIGRASTGSALFACLISFGFFANLLNISINTQATGVERRLGKHIMGSFHGIWSVAGFVGAAAGAWMSGDGVDPLKHYTLICIAVVTATVLSAYYLLEKDEIAGEKKPLFAMPDKALLGLGMIAFCSMMVEGTMYDWSGIYFGKVVKVENEFVGLAYAVFMIAMAATRFGADGASTRFGIKKILQLSGLLATTGLLLCVTVPQMETSLLAFFLIGMGVSSVVPIVYSEAGKSKSLAPGTAITAVSSMGFLGLLIGPPLIGFVAEASSLRISFLVLSALSLAVFVFSSRMTRP